MSAKIPSLEGLALTILRTARGWNAKVLAAKAGLSPSTVSAYETGDLTPPRERLEELARVMELEAEEVDYALLAAALVYPGSPPPETPVDPTPEERRVILKAAAQAGRDTAEQVREVLLGELREEKAKRAREEGRSLLERLKPYSAAARRDLVEGAPDYHHWGLAVALCEESERAAANDPHKALELAELALLVARHVPKTGAFSPRLQGWCTGLVGNAQRVVGESLPRAASTFARARRLWQEGRDEAGLLSEAHLLDLEASLRRAQRLFPQALELHEEALRLARENELGSILLNKSATLEEAGDYEASIQILDEAALVIDGERTPRLRFGLRFNQAASLCRLNRAEEAKNLVPEIRELAERLRNRVDLVKTLWLEGIIAAGLGRRQEALAALEQVRRQFEALTLPYEYALASLDLALLYQQEGRLGEIAGLAVEMLTIFETQSVHREAIASVLLFREAAEEGQVSIELVRRLKDYLAKARSNPRLRFES